MEKKGNGKTQRHRQIKRIVKWYIVAYRHKSPEQKKN